MKIDISDNKIMNYVIKPSIRCFMLVVCFVSNIQLALAEARGDLPTLHVNYPENAYSTKWTFSMNTSGACAVIINSADTKVLKLTMPAEFEKGYMELSRKKLFWELNEFYNAPIPDNPDLVICFTYQNIFRSVTIGYLMGVDKQNLKKKDRSDLKFIGSFLGLIVKQLEKSQDPAANVVATDLKRLSLEFEEL